MLSGLFDPLSVQNILQTSNQGKELPNGSERGELGDALAPREGESREDRHARIRKRIQEAEQETKDIESAFEVRKRKVLASAKGDVGEAMIEGGQ